MNLKEILNASLTRTKSRLAELQGKVEKNEVRSEELAAVKAEVEQLTKEIQTISEELAKLEEKEKEEDPAKKKDDNPEKKEDSAAKENPSTQTQLSEEQRSVISAAIAAALSTEGHKSTNNQKVEIRSAFANFVVGNISEMEARALGIEINNGSVTVPVEISKEVISYAQEENLLRKYGTYVSTDADIKYPVLVKKAEANVSKTERAKSGKEITPTDIEFDSIDLDPAEFDALATITKKLLKRTGVKIEQIVIDELKKAYVRKEINFMFRGNDVGNENPGALAKKSVPFYETVPVKVGEAGWSQVLQDELTIMTGVPVTEVIKKAKWIVNRAAYNLLNRMTDVNGRKLLTKTNGSYEYDGFPLDFTDAANKSDADVTTPVFYFGDFSAFHIQEVKGGMELQKLIEKYAGTNQVGFQIYNLIDGQLIYSPFEPAVYRYEVGEKKQGE
ncbi:phage major capsid protein [Bacillus thuringiensis]|uniref:Phage major capsid protein n=1 Tax=Bacillus thuringiensis TaxID=1428 RepID=A0A9X6K7F6_BACTU|nr:MULTISPECIES: phage major capsid protein [Bacillus cereus group]MDA2615702.1 phage major capsid protein [Bacillus cereus]MEB8556283.1 phage major capsid protein [Bacillus cereus]MEB8726023.1 phage major capsid protein [Bacillus cereus]MEB8971850.1 phage major capsid protein [Bacillus cereus]MEB9136687.1 phage major capsid protein [Bacillus cereus]